MSPVDPSGREAAAGSVLVARDVAVAIAGTPVLRGVSLQVAAGEVVAVMGPSGSGKSTLLHCLSGLVTPDSGDVLLEGGSLPAMGDRARSRTRLARCGFVAQFGDLVPELTLAENVELPLRLLRHGRRAARARAAELLGALGVGEVADHRAGEASGGQVQRAAVARALAHSPAVLLADEPTGALDTITGELVLTALLDQARDHGTAVVLVTHEARVAAHCDREVVLRDGRLRDPTTVAAGTAGPLP